MTKPEGYVVPGEENKMWKLNKAIYCLKQAVRAWHIKIGKSLRKLNFVESIADSSVLARRVGEDTSYVIIYGDDLLIAGKDTQIKKIIRRLRKPNMNWKIYGKPVTTYELKYKKCMKDSH